MKSYNLLLEKTGELMNKIQRLGERMKKLQEEAHQKEEKIAALKNERTTLQERIGMLEQEIAALKLGTALSLSETDKKEVRRKLNEYLRELDGVIEKLTGDQDPNTN